MSVTEFNVPSIDVQITQASTTDIDSWKIQKALKVKQQLEKLLFNGNSVNLTNKTRRQIKKLFNEQVNLTDRMFQGLHVDGQVIGSLKNDEKEIDLLYQILKKTPTLSFAKASSTIKKWIADAHKSEIKKPDNLTKPILTYVSKKHELISSAYQKYMTEVNNKKVVVKTRGLDLVSKCHKYWKSSDVDPVIEEQINKTCDELCAFLSSSFDETFTFKDFANSMVLVLDISGSMSGIPLNTGLFYMLMMVKIFGVTTLHYFDTILEVKTISPEWSSNLALIKQVYTHSRGSTVLENVFRYLNTIKTSNKNVIIITDGDCDPGQYSNNISNSPFHEVTRLDKDASKFPYITNCHYIVVNVNNSEMNFPYLDCDPMVCYLTGNNPKTLNGFIKALSESTKSNTIITPELILKYTLTLNELDFEHPVPKFSSIMSDERINQLFEVFKKNLPPKKPVSTVNINLSAVVDNDVSVVDNGVYADENDVYAADTFDWDKPL